MTEEYELAAKQKICRRLNNLILIQKNIAIDPEYLTCSEYQLFIDDMQKKGQTYRLDHSYSNKFRAEHTDKPVTGVRAHDAEDFCNWLNKEYPLPGYQYRLPTLAEVETKPSPNSAIGCWCMDKNIYVIG